MGVGVGLGVDGGSHMCQSPTWSKTCKNHHEVIDALHNIALLSIAGKLSLAGMQLSQRTQVLAWLSELLAQRFGHTALSTAAPGSTADAPASHKPEDQDNGMSAVGAQHGQPGEDEGGGAAEGEDAHSALVGSDEDVNSELLEPESGPSEDSDDPQMAAYEQD